jgi:hypothetical protein
MGGLNRRTFLARATAAAAATAGVTALAGLEAATAPGLVAAAAPQRAAWVRGEALVAHVRDFATGEVAVLAGGREVVYRDRALVARLLEAVR